MGTYLHLVRSQAVLRLLTWERVNRRTSKKVSCIKVPSHRALVLSTLDQRLVSFTTSYIIHDLTGCAHFNENKLNIFYLSARYLFSCHVFLSFSFVAVQHQASLLHCNI